MFTPNFVTKKIDVTGSFGRYVLTPLPAGYGNSIGNALRRVLLSSIEGAGATSVRINNVSHAFSTIEGVKESVLDILLNIKALRFKTTGEGPYTLTLKANAKGKIFAKDFSGGDVEIVNKDQIIAEVTKDKTKLDIEITVEKGVGYSPSEEREKKSFGTIALDTVFSPVTKVNYRVEGERVGRKTNFDKLTLDITTDGTITPEDSLQRASHILSQFYSFILSGNDEEHEKNQNNVKDDTRQVDENVYETIIDELDLPTRVINALLRENIETVGDLVNRGKDELVNLKGVGRKSVDLVENELEKLNVKLA